VPPPPSRAHPRPSTLSSKVPLRRESGSSAYEGLETSAEHARDDKGRPRRFSGLTANVSATSSTGPLTSKRHRLGGSRAAHTARPHHATDRAHVSSISLTNSSTDAAPHTRTHEWGHGVQKQRCLAKEDCNYPACGEVPCAVCEKYGRSQCGSDAGRSHDECLAATVTWDYHCDHRNQNNEYGSCNYGSGTAGYGWSCPCPTGTATHTYATDEYMGGGGGGFCYPCPAGTFADAPGADDCTDCPAGTFSAEGGATHCDDCPGAPSGSSSCTHQESVRDTQPILMDISIALGNNSVWKRKPINRRGRANENESTAGSVSTRDNSCQYANDGECDEGSYCSYGTDSSDCGTSGDTCEYANDGECDEPSYCAIGTDTSDCSGVGCDGVFNSGKTNDECGVCDGDGSSCSGWSCVCVHACVYA